MTDPINTTPTNVLAVRDRSDMLMPATDSWVAVVRDVGTLARQICDTDFVPVDLRWRDGELVVEDGVELRDLGPAAARVTAVILHGRELGLPPMTALALTHVIEGRPSVAAEAMRAMVFQAGHEIVPVETTSAKCIMKGRRNRHGEWTTVEWTMADAQRLGVQSKKNWLRSPRAMLAARATTELCRLIFADVIHGMRSIEEFDELEAGTEVVETPQIEGPTIRRAAGRQGTPQVTAGAPPSAQRPPDTSPRRHASVPQRGTQPRMAAETPQTDRPESTPATDPPADRPTSPEPGEQGEGQAPETQAERPGSKDEPRPDVPPPDEAPPADEPYLGPPPSKGRIAAMQMHATRLGIGADEDRDFRLTVLAMLAGADPITSSKDLTQAQAVRAIRALETLRDRAALGDALEQIEQQQP